MTRTFTRASIALLLCAAVTACEKTPPVSTTAHAPATDDKLAKIFTPDALGENVAYLEAITGPAFTTTKGAPGTSDIFNIYKVEGCRVIVGVSSGKVNNLGMEDFGPKCHFNIGQYFHQEVDGNGRNPHDVVPVLPAFGDLSAQLGGSYIADCLSLCGNAADPVVTLQFSGSHADGFNQLLASVALVDDASIHASEVWARKLDEKYGNNYSSNLDRSKDNLTYVAADAFKRIKPTTI